MLKKITLLMLLVLTIGATESKAVNLVIDYTYDTNGFFNTGTANGVQARARIENAASTLSGWLSDNWGAISIGSGPNTWTAQFYDPSSTGVITRTNDLSIANNTFVVFVGGYDLGSGVLGSGGAGGYGVSGTQSYVDSIVNRGDTVGFVDWGGSIAFNNTNTVWSFDETTVGLSGKNDFYSVALHELTHTLGFGMVGNPFWDNEVSGSNFIGTHSQAVYGGPVPLSLDGGHWADGTDSQIFLTNTAQEAAMTPALTTGTRKLMTTLDMAGLADLGYNVVPEPSTYMLLLVGLGFAILAQRKRAKLTLCRVTAGTR